MKAAKITAGTVTLIAISPTAFLLAAASVRLGWAGVNGACLAVRLSVVDAVRPEATQYASISRSLSSLMPK